MKVTPEDEFESFIVSILFVLSQRIRKEMMTQPAPRVLSRCEIQDHLKSNL